MQTEVVKVGAIVLAAGMSKRMGRPKMALPYHGSTVIGTVLSVLQGAGVAPLVVVTGGAGEVVEAYLETLPFELLKTRNPDPAHTEMMDSLRIGMQMLPDALDAFLIVLGDQPQIQSSTVAQILVEFYETRQPLIIPSYQMRRGHPWLIGREYWEELATMPPEYTMRDFLQKHNQHIHYLRVDTPSILEDLDTPEDYRRAVES